MRNTSPEQAVERMFESFCKKVLCNRNRDLIRRQKHLGRYEVPICQLTAEPFVYDTYFAEEEAYRFDASDGAAVFICNAALAEALRSITPTMCRIVLLAYCMSFSDRQIAQVLDMKRSTVQYQRNKALSQLYSLLGSYHDREV